MCWNWQRKAAGTAAAYRAVWLHRWSSVAASAIVGYTVDFFGWDGGFMVMIGGSILAVILLIVVMITKNAAMNNYRKTQRRLLA